MGRTAISAYLITRDEEANIARALGSVEWADEVIVLDSGSADATVEIAGKMGAKVFVEPFRGFVEQKNRAMELCAGEWVFNLDADEEVTPELRESILSAMGRSGGAGSDIHTVNRKTWYMGRWIRHCGWYPERRARLCRRGSARWMGDVLHERLEGEGTVGRLDGDLLHRPYPDLGAHLRRIDRYTGLWAEREHGRGRTARWYDLAFRPAAGFFRMYVLKAGFLDGSPGFTASMMGAWYVFMKYSRLRERSGGSV